MESKYLFVYGLLQKKYRFRISEKYDIIPDFNFSFIDKAHLAGELYDLGNYPGLVIPKNKINTHKVHGELYESPEKMDWKELDTFEYAYPTIKQSPEYERKELPVSTGKMQVDAHVYILSVRANQRIENGIY